MKVLVTGGAGYIGSHTCRELLCAGYDVHVIDNLDNGNFEALMRVNCLSNHDLAFTECDVRDVSALDKVFAEFQPDIVVHFAGLKAVGESISKPALYYDVNVGGTATLLRAMERASCDNIVFSSSATIYGEPQYLPCDENHPLSPINPYGRTKLMGEILLQDWSSVSPNTRHAVALRYFNPVGAHVSGLIGEDPRGIPNNLMPYIAQVAAGLRESLNVFGSDYPTHDGTGVRDYIHVVDLAEAHRVALERLIQGQGKDPMEVFNLGTGTGSSVLEVIQSFDRATGEALQWAYAPRRAGDVIAAYADTTKARDVLGWVAEKSLDEAMKDAWAWQVALGSDSH